MNLTWSLHKHFLYIVIEFVVEFAFVNLYEKIRFDMSLKNILMFAKSLDFSSEIVDYEDAKHCDEYLNDEGNWVVVVIEYLSCN